jgi:hypothetical protein
VDGTNKFLRVWLDTLTNIELKVLGYRFYCIKKLEFKDDHERENYIIQLASEIGFQEASWPLPQKLIEIPDNTFSEFIEILFANSHEIWHEYFETLISIHRPDARRFNIKSTLIQKRKNNKDNKDNKKTYSCPICLNDDISYKNIISTNCNHEYCSNCFSEYLNSVKPDIKKLPICACCREKITVIELKDRNIQRLYKENYCRSIEQIEKRQHEEHELTELINKKLRRVSKVAVKAAITHEDYIHVF